MTPNSFKFFLFLFFALFTLVSSSLIYSCSKKEIYFASGDKTFIVENEQLSWSDGIGRKELHRTQYLSFHLVRIDTGEKPHVHQKHDLFVIILKGKGVFFVGDKKYDMKEGDSVFVQRGTPHYFLARGKGVYAIVIFSPPFDGKDTIEFQQ